MERQLEKEPDCFSEGGTVVIDCIESRFGLIILFYSNEHEPVHVHGKFQGTENKAEIIIENGQIVEIRFTSVRGKKPLPRSQMKNFRSVVEQYAEDIVQKWIDYFVLHKAVASETITKRIK